MVIHSLISYFTIFSYVITILAYQVTMATRELPSTTTD